MARPKGSRDLDPLSRRDLAEFDEPLTDDELVVLFMERSQVPVTLAQRMMRYVRHNELDDRIWDALLRLRDHVIYLHGTDTTTGPEQRDTDTGSGAGVS